MTWIDQTKRKYNETAKPPTSWQLETGEITIFITMAHIYHPDEWIMHCKELGYDKVSLNMGKYTPVEQVQEKALKIIKGKAQRILDSLK